MYCQAQIQSFNAYQPFVRKSAALYDVLLRNEVIAYLDPVDTLKPESDLSKSESEIVKISESARPIMKEMEVDVPLFWD